MKAATFVLAATMTVAMILAASPTLSQKADPTPNAWGKVRWGMSLDEVIKAYPDMEASIDPYHIYVSCDYLKHDYLHYFDKNGNKYRYLEFKWTNGKLFAISTGLDETYEQAVNDFTHQYGPPIRRDVPFISEDPELVTVFHDNIRKSRIIISNTINKDCGNYVGITYSDLNNPGL
jgi:hypothetical protein